MAHQVYAISFGVASWTDMRGLPWLGIAGKVQFFEGLLAKIKANEKRRDGIDREQSVIKNIAFLIAAATLAWTFRELTPSRSVQPTIAAPSPAIENPSKPFMPAPARQVAPARPLTESPKSPTTDAPRAPEPIPPDRR